MLSVTTEQVSSLSTGISNDITLAVTNLHVITWLFIEDFFISVSNWLSSDNVFLITYFFFRSLIEDVTVNEFCFVISLSLFLWHLVWIDSVVSSVLSHILRELIISNNGNFSTGFLCRSSISLCVSVRQRLREFVLMVFHFVFIKRLIVDFTSYILFIIFCSIVVLSTFECLVCFVLPFTILFLNFFEFLFGFSNSSIEFLLHLSSIGIVLGIIQILNHLLILFDRFLILVLSLEQLHDELALVRQQILKQLSDVDTEMLVDSLACKNRIDVAIERILMQLIVVSSQEDVLIQTEQFTTDVLIAVHNDLLSKTYSSDIVEVLNQTTCHDEELSISVCVVLHAHLVEFAQRLLTLSILSMTIADNYTILKYSSPHVFTSQINSVVLNSHSRIVYQVCKLYELLIKLWNILLVKRCNSITSLQIECIADSKY